VLTILVWGAWQGLKDKAKVYFHVQAHPQQKVPALGTYSRFVGVTNRYSDERFPPPGVGFDLLLPLTRLASKS